MNDALFRRFTGVGVTLLIACLVWRYYRTETYPAAEKYWTCGPRFLAEPVDSCVLWPVGFVSTGVLKMLTNAKRRALHDFIAGTVVVRLNLQEADEPAGQDGG